MTREDDMVLAKLREFDADYTDAEIADAHTPRFGTPHEASDIHNAAAIDPWTRRFLLALLDTARRERDEARQALEARETELAVERDDAFDGSLAWKLRQVECALDGYAPGMPLVERVALLVTDRDAATRCCLSRDGVEDRARRAAIEECIAVCDGQLETWVAARLRALLDGKEGE